MSFATVRDTGRNIDISHSDLTAFSELLMEQLSPHLENPQLATPFFLDTTLVRQLVGTPFILLREEAIAVLLSVFETLLKLRRPILLQGSPGVGKTLLTGNRPNHQALK